jgi:hypothetical protein
VPVAQQRNNHSIDQMRLTNNQSTRVFLESLDLFYYAHS